MTEHADSIQRCDICDERVEVCRAREHMEEHHLAILSAHEYRERKLSNDQIIFKFFVLC